jgi:hypothetical protein
VTFNGPLIGAGKVKFIQESISESEFDPVKLLIGAPITDQLPGTYTVCGRLGPSRRKDASHTVFGVSTVRRSTRLVLTIPVMAEISREIPLEAHGPLELLSEPDIVAIESDLDDPGLLLNAILLQVSKDFGKMSAVLVWVYLHGVSYPDNCEPTSAIV